MRRLIAGALAALASVWACSAQAQQAFGMTPGPGVADFSGVAFGPDVGLAFGSTGGGAFGGHLGYNFQSGAFVGGAEADAMFANLSNGDAFSLSEKFLTSIRGKGGYAFGNFLAYGTLGVGFSSAQYNTWFGNQSTTLTGAVFGIGGEYALTRNVSLRAELLRYQFGDISYAALPFLSQSIGASTNVLRAGASIRF